MRKLIFLWLAGIVVISACTLLCHSTMKQAISYQTYDDQYALLEQAKELLNQDKKINTLANEMVLETSQQCFIVVYDEVHAISYTNATFEEKPLSVPLTLVIHDEYHEDIYTPNEQLQFATVACSYDKGHIIVGKSMQRYSTMYQTYTDNLLYMYGILCIALFPILFVFKLLTKNDKS